MGPNGFTHSCTYRKMNNIKLSSITCVITFGIVLRAHYLDNTFDNDWEV